MTAAYRPRWHFGAGFFKGFGLGVTLRPDDRKREEA